MLIDLSQAVDSPSFSELLFYIKSGPKPRANGQSQDYSSLDHDLVEKYDNLDSLTSLLKVSGCITLELIPMS